MTLGRIAAYDKGEILLFQSSPLFSGIISDEISKTPQSDSVPCVSLGAVFDFLGWTHIDLLALDTETTEDHVVLGYVNFSLFVAVQFSVVNVLTHNKLMS